MIIASSFFVNWASNEEAKLVITADRSGGRPASPSLTIARIRFHRFSLETKDRLLCVAD